MLMINIFLSVSIYSMYYNILSAGVTIGYIGYFLTMSMFCWMTIMSFDLCWTFIRAKVPNKGSAAYKFSIYSCVAWGSSTVLTILVMESDDLSFSKGRKELLEMPQQNSLISS